MNSLIIKAPAKINLSLDVLRKREDGFHEVEMVMQTIALYDFLELSETEQGVELECSLKWLPCDSSNLAYKAAQLMIDTFSINKGVKIRLEKNIPVAAGLAGGSTDAAAVLKGMNRLFGLGLDNIGLAELGKRLGADVPYCINGGTDCTKN
jgi:4-diphosphocytidyl-2-C-methyl-D-erythritol kinase